MGLLFLVGESKVDEANEHLSIIAVSASHRYLRKISGKSEHQSGSIWYRNSDFAIGRLHVNLGAGPVNDLNLVRKSVPEINVSITSSSSQNATGR